MLPSRSTILAEAISLASTSLQQRESISLASFLNIRIPEAAVQSCFVKKLPEPCNFIKKETLAQVFSSEFCEIFKNTFYHGTTPVAASGICTSRDFLSNTVYNTSAAEP